MKKTLLVFLMAAAIPMVGHAQIGNLLEKAAKKAVNKTTEKVVDKAVDKISDAAADAVNNQMNQRTPKEQIQPAEKTVQKSTYASLMGQLPELPTVNQLVKHKESELNEKTLALLTSKVTIFSTKVLDLSSQCTALGLEDADSARMTSAAMSMASAYTGLSEKELEQLAAMSEEEQQAWLEKHYSQERAQTAMLNQAVDASKWLEPLQPMIDQWTAAGAKVDGVYSEMDAKLRPIYAKYASRLANASGKDRVGILTAYYSEAVPHIRAAVQQALNIRIKEQLPIAEKLEEQMVKVRAAHPDAVSQLLCYPKLTALQYFTETSRLLDLPEYTNE